MSAYVWPYSASPVACEQAQGLISRGYQNAMRKKRSLPFIPIIISRDRMRLQPPAHPLSQDPSGESRSSQTVEVNSPSDPSHCQPVANDMNKTIHKRTQPHIQNTQQAHQQKMNKIYSERISWKHVLHFTLKSQVMKMKPIFRDINIFELRHYLL